VKCPADIEKGLEEKLRSIATECMRIFKFRDYGRVDIRVDGEGKPVRP